MTFIGGNRIPFQALMIPGRDLVIAIGIYDSRWIKFHMAFQTGFCTLLMRSFIRDIPDAALDAARVEGAVELTIFWRSVLPLARPAPAGVSVLVFTLVWIDRLRPACNRCEAGGRRRGSSSPPDRYSRRFHPSPGSFSWGQLIAGLTYGARTDYM